MAEYNMGMVTAQELLDAQKRGEEIVIYCIHCLEITYPEAYNTCDQNETIRICNGCGRLWEIK